jgi:hypothetical protein
MPRDDKSREMVHRAFSVIAKEGAKPHWHEIGASFAHEDGKGLTVVMQSLPLDGRVVLRHLDALPRRNRDADEDRDQRDDQSRRRDRRGHRRSDRPRG